MHVTLGGLLATLGACALALLQVEAQGASIMHTELDASHISQLARSRTQPHSSVARMLATVLCTALSVQVFIRCPPPTRGAPVRV